MYVHVPAMLELVANGTMPRQHGTTPCQNKSSCTIGKLLATNFSVEGT